MRRIKEISMIPVAMATDTGTMINENHHPVSGIVKKLTAKTAAYTDSSYKAPWPKFIIRITPYVMDNLEAITKLIIPVTRPIAIANIKP
jgi:hypothetical protein